MVQRFVEAQAETYLRALQEIRNGRKTSHWMWFVFPQIAGLGRSAMAQRYAIADKSEAEAYLAHPLLGARLREITDAVLALPASSNAEAVFGAIDAVKLRSSMTLFAAVSSEPRFAAVLDKWYDGIRDAATLERL